MKNIFDGAGKVEARLRPAGYGGQPTLASRRRLVGRSGTNWALVNLHLRAVQDRPIGGQQRRSK
jgi:hypothetical protein